MPRINKDARGEYHRNYVRERKLQDPAFLEAVRARGRRSASGEKLFTLAHASRGKYWTYAQIAEEIAKCDVRCPNCHRMRHYREGYLDDGTTRSRRVRDGGEQDAGAADAVP